MIDDIDMILCWLLIIYWCYLDYGLISYVWVIGVVMIGWIGVRMYWISDGLWLEVMIIILIFFDLFFLMWIFNGML